MAFSELIQTSLCLQSKQLIVGFCYGQQLLEFRWVYKIDSLLLSAVLAYGKLSTGQQWLDNNKNIIQNQKMQQMQQKKKTCSKHKLI